MVFLKVVDQVLHIAHVDRENPPAAIQRQGNDLRRLVGHQAQKRQEPCLGCSRIFNSPLDFAGSPIGGENLGSEALLQIGPCCLN